MALINFFSVPNLNFQLENRMYRRCLTVRKRQNDSLIGLNCSSSLNMRWIWVNKTGNVHLMNVMTLQCLEFLEKKPVCTSTNHSQIGEVAMKQCKKTPGQYIMQHQSKTIYSRLCGNTRPYLLRLKKQTRQIPQYLADSQRRESKHEWINEKEMLHRRNSTYRGQY